MQIWDQTDNTSTVTLPLITILRKIPPKQGTNFRTVSYNIPKDIGYTAYKVPVESGGKKSYEIYKVPQPVNIDLEFEVNFFTIFQQDLNKLDQKILFQFKEGQNYVNIKGHQMALHLSSLEDLSNTSDIESRRFYHHKYQFLLKGYLVDEDAFKVLKSLDNINFKVEKSDLDGGVCDFNIINNNSNNCSTTFEFTFTRKGSNFIETQSPFDIFLKSDNQSNSENYDLFINNVEETLPVTINKGDLIQVFNNRVNLKKNILIRLYGDKVIP